MNYEKSMISNFNIRLSACYGLDILTHCGLIYGDIYLPLPKPIIGNVDYSSVMSCDIQLRVILKETLKISILEKY